MKKTNSPDNVLIIGCGDIGVRVARLILAEQGQASGLARTDTSVDRLRRLGVYPVIGNLDDQTSLENLQTKGKIILFMAPPPGGGLYDTRMRNFCQAVGSDKLPSKVVYMSTSGVYGDCGGEWVTEETPVNPRTSRAQRRVDAETVLREWSQIHEVPHVILRVTGIYGPGRLPLERIKQGHPVLTEADSPPTNRIHADDLAMVSIAATAAQDGAIYNVSDGQPGTMTQYFNLAADLVGISRPKQVSMDEAKQVMNPMMLSYLQETRRMDNRKLIDELGIVLQYPDLDSGLKHVVEQLEEPNMGYFGSIGH